jgi:two-component system, OmpR family, response regulator
MAGAQADISHNAAESESRPPDRPEPRLLLVEDDVKLARTLERGLEREGYCVDLARDGDDALAQTEARDYDIVVLDVLLPGADGHQVCRALRERDRWVPVLMLTALGAVEDRIRGLDTGADDYLVKPFSFAELLVRLRALKRRAPAERPVIVRVGDLRLDPACHRAWRGEEELDLSPKEFALLALFMTHPGQVLSRQQLLEAGWDMGYERRSNLIDVYVGYLRQKMDKPFGSHSLETVRGVGYRLREDGG